MPAVHEQMQHGTQKEQHIRQDTEDMRSVFQQEEEGRNGEEPEQDQPTW
jgi:hypothetical protein